MYAQLRRNMDVIIGIHIKYIRDHDPAPEKLLEKSRHPFSSLYINQKALIFKEFSKRFLAGTLWLGALIGISRTARNGFDSNLDLIFRDPK